MQQKNIYFKSDLTLILKSEAGWAVPFRLKFYTNVPSRCHVASYDGTSYTGCHLIDSDNLCIDIDNTGTDGRAIMGLGKLMMAPEFYLDNDHFNDQVCNEFIAPSAVVATDTNGTQYEINLDLSGSSTLQTIGTLPAYYQKGAKGDPGDGTITPILTSGTKIATVTTPTGTKDLYAPNGGATSADQVSYNGTTVKATLDTDGNRLTALENEIFPLVLTASISPTSLKEKGSGSTSVSLSWAATISGSSVAIETSKVNGAAVTGTSMTDTITDSKTYTIMATSQGRTATASKSVTYVYPTYVNFANTTSGADVPLANKQSLDTKINLNNISINNATGGAAYLWIVSPYTPASVKESAMGIAIPGSVVATDGSMKYWRSTEKLNAGTWGLTIKS